MNKNANAAPGNSCVCGVAGSFSECCGPYIDGKAQPQSALALMRSRYSAYALGHDAYLLQTWHPSTRPPTLGSGNGARWIRLDVVRHEQNGEDRAVVEFDARYKINGRAHRLHEISRFVREDERWFYVDGDVT